MLKAVGSARSRISMCRLRLCLHAKRHRNGSSRRERVLDKDLDAYHRLRLDGQQPKAIDGAAIVEKRAEENWQVATGIVPDKTNVV
jgi:hypothetical protein